MRAPGAAATSAAASLRRIPSAARARTAQTCSCARAERWYPATTMVTSEHVVGAGRQLPEGASAHLLVVLGEFAAQRGGPVRPEDLGHARERGGCAPGDAWLARLVHYGDGEVRLLNRQQCQWRSVCQSDHVDEVDDRSFALPLATQPRWEYEFSWQPGDVLVLATEGIAYYLDSETKVGHYLSRSWCSPPDRWAFLSDVAFRTLCSGDDRTVVALWRTDVEHIAGSSELGVGGGV